MGPTKRGIFKKKKKKPKAYSSAAIYILCVLCSWFVTKDVKKLYLITNECMQRLSSPLVPGFPPHALYSMTDNSCSTPTAQLDSHLLFDYHPVSSPLSK